MWNSRTNSPPGARPAIGLECSSALTLGGRWQNTDTTTFLCADATGNLLRFGLSRFDRDSEFGCSLPKLTESRFGQVHGGHGQTELGEPDGIAHLSLPNTQRPLPPFRILSSWLLRKAFGRSPKKRTGPLQRSFHALTTSCASISTSTVCRARRHFRPEGPASNVNNTPGGVTPGGGY